MKKIIFLLYYLIVLYAQESPVDQLLFFNYKAISIDGDTISMNNYIGKKVLLVNVASQCGFTPQYAELQKLHEGYKDEISVLAFPSNDFLWQEPGSNSEIKAFCQREYGVTFQIFSKIKVKGKEKHPIYHWLSNDKINGWNSQSPTWNFCKYLINEKGELLKYFGPSVSPLDTQITNYLQPLSNVYK